jgi:hypothetical protein
MFGLFSRLSRPRALPARRTTSLFLERLEDRLSPSMGGAGGGVQIPETITLNATYNPNKYATFSGQLTNRYGPVANHSINLTGVVNASTITDANGKYTTKALNIPNLGTEYAASTDGLSNTAQFTLVGGSPVISNFKAVSQGGGLWLLSGNVTGAPAQGEIINFGGINALQGQSTPVNLDGSFTFYVMVKSGQGGWASAEAVDWWGDTSDPAAAFVNC